MSLPRSGLRRKAAESPGLAASRPEHCPLSWASMPDARSPCALGLLPCSQSPLHPCSLLRAIVRAASLASPEPGAGTQWGLAVTHAFHTMAVVGGP